MWTTHWNITSDPFLEPCQYVSTPTHEEVIARLRHWVDTAQPLGIVWGGSGLGKSMLMTELVRRGRDPSRRFSRVATPSKLSEFVEELARKLGRRVPSGSHLGQAWIALADGLELLRLQGIQSVVLLDGLDRVLQADGGGAIERLIALGARPGSRLTVLATLEPSSLAAIAGSWPAIVPLRPLTRSETSSYVERKLASRGRVEPAFGPLALARLHACSGGIPAAIDRIGALSLRTGAEQGASLIGPEIVERVALEVAWPVETGVVGAGWPTPTHFC